MFAFSLQNYVILCLASFCIPRSSCLLLKLSLYFLLLHSSPIWWNWLPFFQVSFFSISVCVIIDFGYCDIEWFGLEMNWDQHPHDLNSLSIWGCSSALGQWAPLYSGSWPSACGPWNTPSSPCPGDGPLLRAHPPPSARTRAALWWPHLPFQAGWSGASGSDL